MKSGFSLLFVSLMGISIAQAKIEATYSVQVDSRNQGSSETELITYLAGYSCRASTSIVYSEVMKDHQGLETRVPKAQTYNSNWSTIFNQGRTSDAMLFARNLYNSDPSVNVQLQETCEKDYACIKQEEVCDTNSRGESVNCHLRSYPTTCTDTNYLNWDCRFNELPKNNASLTMRCLPNLRNSWNSDFILGFLRKKEIFAKISHLQSREKFVHDSCPQGGKEARIIHFEQGIGGHAGEDDFEIDVTIDGTVYPIFSANGLYAEDIRVCKNPNGKAPEISIEGWERDLFFDDHYLPMPGDQILSLAPGQAIELVLTRKSYTGGLFTPTKSKLKIKALQ